MAWTDLIGPIINIAGNVLSGSGSGKDNAAEKTQAALATQSSAAEKRISDVRRITAGFIDPNVNVQSPQGRVPANQNASTLLKMAFTRGGENLTDKQNTTIEQFISRLEQDLEDE